MTYCSVVAALVSVRLTKERFAHYAILKILSFRSPSKDRDILERVSVEKGIFHRPL